MKRDVPKPFLKWAGGKGQLLGIIDEFIPEKFKMYFEPFVGGGAVFFHLCRKELGDSAFLSDLNEELVTAYMTIRDSVEELISELESETYNAKKRAFYDIRAWDRTTEWVNVDPIRKTARMIYLNRTCYNGLYRVNQKGQFNVPFGRYKNPTICDEENLRAVSESLKSATIRCIDFEDSIKKARKGDFVYFDPPYQPVSETAYFTDYTDKGFDESEQRRLARVFRELHNRGCSVLESNSATPLIRELYSDEGFVLETVQAKRAISCDPTGRGDVEELLIRNYKPPKRPVQARLDEF